jgi:hypothetical protein
MLVALNDLKKRNIQIHNFKEILTGIVEEIYAFVYSNSEQK